MNKMIYPDLKGGLSLLNSMAEQLTEEKSQPCNSHPISEYINQAVHKILVYHKQSVNSKQLSVGPLLIFFSPRSVTKTSLG